MTLPIELDDVQDPIHDCQLSEPMFGGQRSEGLVPIEHEANSKDWHGPYSSQSYQVYQCNVCKDYWGCRYQYDAGTGADDKWHRFGPNLTDVKRHY